MCICFILTADRKYTQNFVPPLAQEAREGTGSDSISSAAMAAITAVITSLLTLPLGVLIGCSVCGLWARKKRAGGRVDGQLDSTVHGQPVAAAEDEVIYEEPCDVRVQMNEAYIQMHLQENN